MSDKTATEPRHGTTIEWTHGSGFKGETWNPVTGCSHASEGCDHCYAESLTRRFAKAWSVPDLPWTPENAAENVVLHPERLRMPYRWRHPRSVFVNSMSDLFHPRVPSSFINDVWMAMYNNPRHRFMILTKRPKRMRDWTLLAARAKGWPADEIWPDWIWVGASVESRDWVGRADLLRDTPAAVRFISAEPLLGPLVYDRHDHVTAYDSDWRPVGMLEHGWADRHYTGPQLDLEGIAWLIVGGESGRDHRPMRLEWVRELITACRVAGTAPFVKQLGGLRPGSKLEDLPEDLRVREYPRGRQLSLGGAA